MRAFGSGAQTSSGSSFGDIAQLGERVLCKHEVVGSIPSVSTILLGLGRSASCDVSEPGVEQVLSGIPVCHGPMVRLADRLCAKESDIVKRECVPVGQRELPATGHVRQAYGDAPREDAHHRSFCDRAGRDRSRFAAAADRGGAWITRAIKCLKSIWWMPWR